MLLLLIFSFFVDFEFRADPKYKNPLYETIDSIATANQTAHSETYPFSLNETKRWFGVIDTAEEISIRVSFEATGYNITGGIEGSEFFPGIPVEAKGKITKFMNGIERVTIINRNLNTPSPFPYYDPLQNPSNRLYSFEKYPIIGEKERFEIRYERAYLLLKIPYGFIEFGKNKIRWGPGYRGTVFISGYAKPLDFIYHLSLERGPFRFDAFYASTPDTIDLRRISAQRVELKLDRVIVGLNEGVISTREDFLKYFNPMGLYYIYQRRGRDNLDNLFASMDIAIYPKKNLKIYGELLDDDIVITQSHRAPSRYGVLAGFYLILQNTHLELRGEASYFSRWSLAHISYTNSLEIMGYPLGFYAGPDCIDLYLEAKKSFSWGKFSLFYELLRHGEGNLNTPFGHTPEDDPWLKTPSGVVDTRNILGLKIRGSYRGFHVYLEGGISLIKNYANSKDKNFNEFFIRYSLISPDFELKLPFKD